MNKAAAVEFELHYKVLPTCVPEGQLYFSPSVSSFYIIFKGKCVTVNQVRMLTVAGYGLISALLLSCSIHAKVKTKLHKAWPSFFVSDAFTQAV